MQRIKSTICQPAFIMLVSFAAFGAFAAMSSCFFDTKTNLCQTSGIRCSPDQVCAVNEAACVEINGCGNGVIDGEEACDDGNVSDGDGCSMQCDSNETCGNGVVDEIKQEQCDYAAPDSSSCSQECKFERCGNRILDPGELCDDGNQLSNDGCTADCSSNEACGNGVLDLHLGETCEFANKPFPRPVIDIPTCDNDCTGQVCGDGHTNGPAGELCDPGSVGQDAATCDSNCTPARCGDEHTNAAAGEQCDDGDDNSDTDERPNSNTAKNACRTDCRRAYCGDGVEDDGEACDDHNANEGDFCPSKAPSSGETRLSCQPAICGDGWVRTSIRNDDDYRVAEQCDDANSATNDDCIDCKTAYCGDGYIHLNELCDPEAQPSGCGANMTCSSCEECVPR